jgi:hypothetical protein
MAAICSDPLFSRAPKPTGEEYRSKPNSGRGATDWPVNGVPSRLKAHPTLTAWPLDNLGYTSQRVIASSSDLSGSRRGVYSCPR